MSSSNNKFSKKGILNKNLNFLLKNKKQIKQFENNIPKSNVEPKATSENIVIETIEQHNPFVILEPIVESVEPVVEPEPVVEQAVEPEPDAEVEEEVKEIIIEETPKKKRGRKKKSDN